MAETLCPLTFNNSDSEVDIKCKKVKCAWWIMSPNLGISRCAITMIALLLQDLNHLKSVELDND